MVSRPLLRIEVYLKSYLFPSLSPQHMGFNSCACDVDPLHSIIAVDSVPPDAPGMRGVGAEVGIEQGSHSAKEETEAPWA